MILILHRSSQKLKNKSSPSPWKKERATEREIQDSERWPAAPTGSQLRPTGISPKVETFIEYILLLHLGLSLSPHRSQYQISDLRLLTPDPMAIATKSPWMPMVLLCLSMIASLSHAFYLPGVAPADFQKVLVLFCSKFYIFLIWVCIVRSKLILSFRLVLHGFLAVCDRNGHCWLFFRYRSGFLRTMYPSFGWCC